MITFSNIFTCFKTFFNSFLTVATNNFFTKNIFIALLEKCVRLDTFDVQDGLTYYGNKYLFQLKNSFISQFPRNDQFGIRFKRSTTWNE